MNYQDMEDMHKLLMYKSIKYKSQHENATQCMIPSISILKKLKI